MRHTVVDRLHRIVVVIIVLALVGIAMVGAQVAGIGLPDANGLLPQGLDLATYGANVAIISGHSGNDSGAICEDAEGNPTLTEADVNARVSQLAAERLRRTGATVTILQEYDPQIDGLRADLLLSIHADSCIDQSGFKAAHYVHTTSPEEDERLVSCIKSEYSAATGLTFQPDTITENMTDYHAFRKIADFDTAAILEVGFLGGDRALLESNPEIVAQGVVNGILCFLHNDPPPAPTP